jgi:hypothetical protein
MEKRGPLATKLLDKFQKFQYAVTPLREWDMIATLEPIHGRDLADTDEVKLDENYRWKN